MGRPAGWLKELTGRNPVISPGHPGTRRGIEREFWQYSAVLHDRLDAAGFAEKVYTEPAQLLHIGRDNAGMLMPWLDEMVRLSTEGKHHERFHRMQALWFFIADVIAPHIQVSPVRLTPLQRARARPFSAQDRVPEPVRREAMQVRDVLHSQFTHRWTLARLAALVDLSPKQLAPVFARAFGKTPTAYLVMVRVQEMARLLRETTLTVTEIGQRVGWRSRSRAVEAFIAHTGLTPSGYRKMRTLVTDLP